MVTIRAHFDGRVFVPDEAVDFPVGQELIVRLEPQAALEVVRSEKDLLDLFAEMDADSVNTGHFVDYSRESIYNGTIDDPR